jgi:hypothetical protein
LYKVHIYKSQNRYKDIQKKKKKEKESLVMEQIGIWVLVIKDVINNTGHYCRKQIELFNGTSNKSLLASIRFTPKLGK